MQRITLSIFLLFLLFSESVVAQYPNISGVVNEYRKVTAVDSSKGIIKLADASNMTQYIGRTAMLIQMKGAVINETNTSSFGDISPAANINQAGFFELGKICAQQTDTIIFENKLQNFYDPAGLVQLIVLPAYSNVIINDTIKATSWSSSTGVGGVIAMESTDTIFLNAPIYADSSGFRGGTLINHPGTCSDFNFPPVTYTCTEYYLPSTPTVSNYKHGGKKGEGIAEYISSKEHARGKQANGGGGGNNLNNGGGGGGNFGSGGSGGYKTGTGCTNSNPGISGSSLATYGYSSSAFRIFMGGGGGAGHEDNNYGTPGGNGGGIIYIKARVIVSAGKIISANGGKPYNPALILHPNASGGDGGGGGGAGGVIILSNSDIVGNLILQANGGDGANTGADGGACTGPGGGGGGGVIWLSTASQPGSVTANLTGGLNGGALTCAVNPNGATSGTAGALKVVFALPALRDSSPVCKSILPQSLFVSFEGKEEAGSRRFHAELRSSSSVYKCILQGSEDGRKFSNISSASNNGTNDYDFNIPVNKRVLYYRILVITSQGSEVFSSIIPFRYKPSTLGKLNIYPNPVEQRLKFTLDVFEKDVAEIKIIDQLGRESVSLRLILHPMVREYSLPVSGLPKGNYRLVLSTAKQRVSRAFSK